MSDLTNAIKQVCDEKGLSYEAVIETIESALAAAYRKDFGDKNQNIKVEFDSEVSQSKVFDVKTVVEDMPEEEVSDDDEEAPKDKKANDKASKKKAEEKEEKKDKVGGEEDEEERKFNPRTEIQIKDAKLIKKTAKVGDEIKMKLDVPESYGRMAAQTAKQVIIQRLREAERNMIFDEFKDKEGEVISGVVQRREGRIILIDLGKTTGVLGSEDQIFNENYTPGNRIKVYVKEVRSGSKGADIILSRTSEEIIKKVFYLEIPEISNGLIELKSVAREAGSRSKVAVVAVSDNIDPIGSCVGQRGARIQTIISELGGEKVDIIEYSDDPKKFIANALSPAKVIDTKLEEKEKRALVSVAEDQLSLAIGKNGQNVRLAARLTGWKINIEEYKNEKTDDNKETAEEKEDGDENKEKDAEEKKEGDKKKGDKKKDKEKNKEEKSKAAEKDSKKKEAKDKEKNGKKTKTKKTDKKEDKPSSTKTSKDKKEVKK